jgi:large subunit ribosomal protein L2
MRIEYDPNRTAYIALVCYQNGIISYILCVEGLHVGDRIKNYNFLNSYDFVNSSIFSIKGNSLLLKDVPSGSLVCNIELYPGLGSCFCKSAGTFAIVLNKYYINNKFYILVRLPSGIEYLLLENCRVVLGIVSNINYKLISFKKAGKSRNKGIRPVVRGVAKNPVDHPHGGGEGRKSPKRCARSR